MYNNNVKQVAGVTQVEIEEKFLTCATGAFQSLLYLRPAEPDTKKAAEMTADLFVTLVWGQV